MYDIFEKLEVKEIKCLDKGIMRILDIFPRIIPDGKTAEFRIVQAARVSYGDGTKTMNEDEGLIRYLMRSDHSSPFEHVHFTFHIKAPLFTIKQLIRTRTANVNEQSYRYSICKDEFYIPEVDNVRKQSSKNKQVSEGQIEEELANDFIDRLDYYSKDSYAEYNTFLDKGVNREQARMILPQNLYSELYWTIDLHNLLHFIGLRSHPHAQQEIRVYSDAILSLITPLVPSVIRAFNDYSPMRNAITFSRLEIDALKLMLNRDTVSVEIDSENKGEKAEWNEKLKLLGVD